MSGARKEHRAITVSRNIYERLLFAYPKRFRELYGEEMIDVFEDKCLEQVRSGGRICLLWVWAGAFADLLSNAALERKRFELGFSVVRGGGFLAAAGGTILAISGLLMSWLLYGQTFSYAWNVATVGQMVGMLLLALSLTGLVALVAGNGNSHTPSDHQGRLFNIRHFTGAQLSAATGFFAVVVAALAALGLLAMFLVYEVIGVAGSNRPYPGDLENFLYTTLGLLATFGLPLALILLGVAVRRSGTMGRRSLLPVGVGLATFLIPLTTLTVSRVLWNGYLPQSSFLAAFVTVGVPALAIGAMWTLLGLTIVRNENIDRAPV